MSPNGVSTGEENGYSPVSTAETKESKEETKLPLETKENNESLSSDEQSDDAEIIVPPDGGWGWVVVIASFLSNMVVDGIVYGFGIFLEDIAAEFNQSTTYVSLVGSLLSGFYLMVGPFTSALANRYGFRLVAILGSIVSAAVFGLSYFANSVMYLCLVYGILGGIGFGFIYVPAVITVGFYFERLRALATGIGVCGSGIGTFVFVPLWATLIKAIGWRNAILAQSLTILTCILFALTYRPLKPTKIKNLKNKEDDLEKPELVMDSSKLNPTTRLKMEKALAHMRSGSTNSLNENNSTIPRMLGVSNNAAYPTAAQVWKTDYNKVYHTVHVPHHHRLAQIYNKEKRPGIPFITVQDEKGNDKKDENTTLLLDQEDTLKPVIMTGRRHTIGERKTFDEVARKKSLNVEINRPMYRDDIFFNASLNRLPQYTSQCSLAYNLSVTRPPTKHEIEEEVNKECRFCPESIRRPLATMLDISLLKSVSFLVLAVSGLLTMLGFFVPFVYLKDRAVLSGIDSSKAVWLISTIGITNTIGRVLSGMFSSLPQVNVLLVNNISLTIGGIATILSGLSMSEEYQFGYAVVFGLSMSCFVSLRPILVVELVGLDRLTNAFGLILLFQGIAACAGTPMAGAFFNATGSYEASFYLSGSLILASAIICYPLNIINRWEKNKLGVVEEKSVAI